MVKKRWDNWNRGLPDTAALSVVPSLLRRWYHSNKPSLRRSEGVFQACVLFFILATPILVRAGLQIKASLFKPVTVYICVWKWSACVVSGTRMHICPATLYKNQHYAHGSMCRENRRKKKYNHCEIFHHCGSDKTNEPLAQDFTAEMIYSRYASCQLISIRTRKVGKEKKEEKEKGQMCDLWFLQLLLAFLLWWVCGVQEKSM